MVAEQHIAALATDELLARLGPHPSDGDEAHWALPTELLVGTSTRQMRVCREIMASLGEKLSRRMRPVDVTLTSSTNHEGELVQTISLIVAAA